MNYILFDGSVRNQLLPFTFTRPVADIRVGILTIREKWEMYLGFATSTVTEDYLSEKFPMVEMERNILINASCLPNDKLVSQIKDLRENQAIFIGDEPLAFFSNEGQEIDFDSFDIQDFPAEDVMRIQHTWDIFRLNGETIQQDFDRITLDRKSESIPETTPIWNAEKIFIEPGAKLPLCSLNASNGPIYIGKDSEIMEGSMIRGPFAL